MQITGENTFEISRERLWTALNDPEVLQHCLPGCEDLEVVSDTEFKGRLGLKIGQFKISFKGRITLSDINPPASYRLTGSGDGGLTGNATGTALVELRELSSEKTQLNYSVDPTVGGRLAQIGQRLVRSSIQTLAGQFCTALENHLMGRAQPEDAIHIPQKIQQTQHASIDRSGTSITINGTAFAENIEPRTLLVDFIRDVASLPGTRVGCDTSQCGACTVHLNGKAVKACSVLAMACHGQQVMTIEGVASDQLHPLQQAFRDHHALQCGYCTSGMILAGLDMINRLGPDLTTEKIRSELKGNICRCTGYTGIVNAIYSAARNPAKNGVIDLRGQPIDNYAQL